MKIYTFIAMYDFVVEYVKSFRSEENAILAWEDYTGAEWNKQLQSLRSGHIDESIISYKHSGFTIIESCLEDYSA